MAAVKVDEMVSILSLIEMNARQARESFLSANVVRQRAQRPGVLVGGTDVVEKIKGGRVVDPMTRDIQAADQMHQRGTLQVQEVLSFSQLLSERLFGNGEQQQHQAE